jgi:hypothetical protein
MAHRRAAARSHGWVRWLAVPAALALDVAAAAYLAGTPFPTGAIVPEIVLVAAPLAVYGTLAALVFRAEPLATRLVAAAILLGIHAGLIALHTVAYVTLWSLPAPAAIRLAHRWSPLIPLLQLIWVPLLALPLAGLIRRESSTAPRRRVSPAARRDAVAIRAPQPSSRERVQPAREVRVDPSPPEPTLELPPLATPAAPAAPRPMNASAVSVTDLSTTSLVVPPVPTIGEVPEAPLAVEPGSASTRPGPWALSARVVPAALPEMSLPPSASPPPAFSPTVPSAPPPESSEAVAEASAGSPAVPVLPRAMAPAPVWFDELVEVSAPASDPEPAVTAQAEAPPAASAPLPADVVALVLAPPAAPVTAEPAAAAAVFQAGTQEAERTPPRAVDPPVDPYLVARLFEPYGALLSRDRTILVDWTPRPDAAVLCAAPRGMFRDQAIRLGARLARVLDAGAGPSAPGPVRRLSLRSRDGVVVLAPLDGAVLVAASRRRGALALLEVLSARVVPGPIRGPLDTVGDDPAPTIPDISASRATRVETSTATIDVLAPDGMEATALGELAGRLLAAISQTAAAAPDALSVDLGLHCLMVHPVHPDARPPRFVAVLGGRERSGLLGRRTEQAARALRAAS